MEDTGGQPKARSRLLPDERREHLLRTALKVFARDGVASSSILQITQAAGVSNGTFYRYFANKEALEAAVGAKIVDDLSRDLVRDQVGLRPRERVAVAAVWVMRRVAADPEFGGVVAEYFEQRHEVIRDTARDMAEDIQAGVASGEFAARQPTRFVVSMFFVTFGACARDVLAGGDPNGLGELLAAAHLRMLGVAFDEAAETARWAVQLDSVGVQPVAQRRGKSARTPLLPG